LKKPYFNKACLAYSEQVGSYLQELGKKGDIIPWYNLINPKKKIFNMVPNFFQKKIRSHLFIN